jgi:hypothetical protein
MKKKEEEKILDALRNQVFLKDAKIKNRYDSEDLKKATKEALLEMTELTEQEINIIEKNVRERFKQRRIRRISLMVILGVLTTVSAPFIYYYSVPYQFNNKLIFSEEFNSNENGWYLYDDYSYERYFEKGSYIFTSNKEDSCYDDVLSLHLPKQFTAEITTTWIKGQYDEYGPKFITTYDGYNWFLRLKPKNKTSPYRNTSQYKPDWIFHDENADLKEDQHTQKVIFTTRPWIKDPYVRSLDMNYFVNNKHIKDILFDDLGTYRKDHTDKLNSEMLITVCGCQTVSFDLLKLWDTSTGKIIFDGKFEDIKNRLHPGKKIHKISSIKNGQYILTTNDIGQCYKTVIPMHMKKHSKISLTSSWIKGENCYYGLVVEQDDYNYYAFNLKSDGKASFILHRNGDNEIFLDDLEIGLENTRDIKITQNVIFKGNSIEYFVNDIMVLKEKAYLNEINNIGIQVCGIQTVAFDKIEVRE